MPGLAELHQLLAAVEASLTDGHSHTKRAKDLLEEARRAIVDAQAQADPWLPPQLAQAFEQIETQFGRLAGVGELLSGYRARL